MNMSLLGHLKKETAGCHEKMEQSLDLLRRVETTDDYRALLTRFFTLYDPLENKLANTADWSAASWDFSSRLKTPWLEQDLTALGMTAPDLSEAPRCEKLPSLEGWGATVGCLYVLEGSTLGGQMISRQFHDQLGITLERGGRFFHSYGEATVSRWRAFGAWAETQALAADNAFADSAARGARDTFNTFSQWLK